MTAKPSEEHNQKLETMTAQAWDRVLRWSHSLATSPADREGGYFRTPQYQRLLDTIGSRTTRILALTSPQGVGKTATLVQLHHDLNRSDKSWEVPSSVLIIWGDKSEQIKAMPDSGEFFMFEGSRWLNWRYRCLLYLELKSIELPEGKELPGDPHKVDVEWTEKTLGKARCLALREAAWFENFSPSHKVILIDLPDYARTDRRLLNRHLNQIQRLWIKLSNLEKQRTIVIAIQKDFIGGHFFFGKMDKIELDPLSTDQLLASYKANFGSAYPFTETALRIIASRCRGNYRRFKRYVALAIELWPQNASINPISDEHVSRVISTERVAEDLDVELEQIFPKNPDSRRDAVRIILHLSDSGPSEQGELAKVLEIPEYTLSRLLSKLEPHRYVARQSRGLRKIVSLVQV